jgi:hypothetical protein
MITQKINYKQVRDLGGIFSATFGFIKQNFKPLYGSLLFFAGPFLLIGALISSYMMRSAFTFTQSVLQNDLMGFYSQLIVAYVITILVMFIGITVYTVILNRNIIENENLQAGELLNIKLSTKSFWPDFWRILGNTLLLIIVFVIALFLIVLIVGGLIALAGSGGTGGAVITGILLVLIMFAAFLIFGPILAFLGVTSIFVCQREETGIFFAMSRVFHYMRGNFWQTWSVNLVGLLTYSVMHLIVQLPAIIVTVISSTTRMRNTEMDDSTSILLVVTTAISTLLGYGVMVFYHLIAVYQFTSLEEKKEGVSIIQKINQI